mmetsp:Transcript_17725/g.46750  ORF Transcript_17725/g.46750 Transcript_17725/m.46750 type:complete len:618 (+) Transcript_17725:130-1983(+)
MPVCGTPDALYVGREYASASDDLRGMLSSASEAKFDFVVIPLCKRPEKPMPCEGTYELRPSTNSDLALDSKTWSSAVVGTLSSWLDPDAAKTAGERDYCRQALEQELHWASHLGVYGILLPPPSSPHCELYAAALGRFGLGGICTTQLMIRIPLILEREGEPQINGWEMWNNFRLLCDQNSRLQVALELTADLPSTDREMERWLAEPVRAVIVPADVFLTNKQGFPVLSKRHKSFLLQCFRYRVQVILQGLPDKVEGTDPEKQEADKYLHYIARLFQSKPALTPQEQFELPYHDYLQAPLQPLQDDLESQTYETFEKDPVKYVRYEEAIFRCMQHKMAAGRTEFAAIVVGAGRGPLVAAVRSAAARAKAEVQVWAVEKNPNAVITLRHRCQIEGWTNVEVVSCDMRFWSAPRKADIIVSELLGSFGDNELSPECLDGAQRFLAEDGVVMPCKYTSYLTPVTTPKLWNDVKNYNDLAHFETAYVVKFHQAFYPCKDIKECFKFAHPNWELTSNDRYEEIDFTAEVDALVHGFAGYFHCELYEGLEVSINPDTYSEGMFSWFPIYFPLRTPVIIRTGQQLKSHWWRCTNDKKVWYEWAVSRPTPAAVHNPGGRSYYIGK